MSSVELSNIPAIVETYSFVVPYYIYTSYVPAAINVVSFGYKHYVDDGVTNILFAKF